MPGSRRDGLRPDAGTAARALPERCRGGDRLHHRDGRPRQGPPQRDRGAAARAGAVGRPDSAQEGRSARTTTRSRLGPDRPGFEAGVGEPTELVGHGGGPFVVGGHRGHGIGRVDRDDHVAQDEAPPGPEHARDAGEQVRLLRPLQVVDGQGRDDEVERAARQRVAQLGHPQLRGGPRQALPGRAEHGVAPVDPDGGRAGMARQHGGQRLARPGPEVEDRRRRQPGRGRCHLLLESLIGGNLLAHQVQIGGGIETKLGHDGPWVSARIVPS